MKRLAAAFRKLAFCYRISGSMASFGRLMINTKGLAGVNSPVPYALKLPDGVHTVYLRADDLQIFYDIFLTGIYQLPFLQAKTIVDIGAHVGMAALFFQSRCPNASVYCIEADPDNFVLLQKNVKAVMVNAAISDRNEPVYLQQELRSFNTHVSQAVTALSVPGITIQSFLKQQGIDHIDIVKIDIEGAERVLFEGDVSWLSMTDNILIELHSAEDVTLFSNTVTAYGFRIEVKQYPYDTIYCAYRLNHLSARGSSL